jgi:hypothetical protein
VKVHVAFRFDVQFWAMGSAGNAGNGNGESLNAFQKRMNLNLTAVLTSCSFGNRASVIIQVRGSSSLGS